MSMSADNLSQLTLSQKEWTRLIHQVLVYLTQNNPPLSSGLYKIDRQVLPADFTDSTRNAQYCYPFKGTFLPSGNLDGKVWKPSQGAKPTGTGLLKRYFYYKKDSVRIKRQVIWLIDREDWCFLDYRFIIGGAKSKIKLDTVMIPPGLNFGHLVSLASKVAIPSEIYEKKKIGKAGRKSSPVDDDTDDEDADEPMSHDVSATRGYYPEPAPAKFTPDKGYTPVAYPPSQAASYPPSNLAAPSQQAYLSTSPYAHQGFAYVDPASFMPSNYSSLYSSGERPAPLSLFGSSDSFDLGDAPSSSSGLLEMGDVVGDSPSLPPVFDATTTDSSLMCQYIDDSITGMGSLSPGTGMELDDDAELYALDRQVGTLLSERVSSFTQDDVEFYPTSDQHVPTFFEPSMTDITYLGDSSQAETPTMSKKRKTSEAIAFPEVSALSIAEPPPVSMPSFFVAPMDYIIGTIADHMCKQLVFKRQVFLRTGVDCDTLLEKMKMQRVAIDFREFPGRIVTSFFQWLFEHVCRLRHDMLPPIYCMVCGRATTMPHDEHQHAIFYKSLDPALVQQVTSRVRNMYDLVHQMLAYLLKFPQRHQSFRTTVDTLLHCPFCSGQHGEHNDHQHKVWKDILRLEVPATLSKEPPKPAGNLEQYTKVTFEWILDQVPFAIPPFLLRLQCVQSFLECAVVMWRTVRLT